MRLKIIFFYAMRHKVLEIPFDVLTLAQARDKILDALRKQDRQLHVATPNPEMLLDAQINKPFEKVLQGTWLNIPDGIGILWASSFEKAAENKVGFSRALIGLKLLLDVFFRPNKVRAVFKERVTGTDLMQELCNASQPYNIPIFLLGSTSKNLKKTEEILLQRYSKLNIAGKFTGTPNARDWSEIKKRIDKSNAKLLFVAYGAPKQELWINKHLKELTSVKVAIGIGGAFDYIAGKRLRAPTVFQKIGIEWLFRLLQQPSRIRRIYNAAVKFPFKVIFK